MGRDTAELYAFGIASEGPFTHKIGYHLKHDKSSYLFAFSENVNGGITSKIEISQGSEEKIKQEVEKIESKHYNSVTTQLTKEQAQSLIGTLFQIKCVDDAIIDHKKKRTKLEKTIRQTILQVTPSYNPMF